MLRGFVFLSVAILFNGVANVLMKKGMVGSSDSVGLMGMIKHYFTSWPLVLGLSLFAINIVAYTQALSKIPLAVAYPIMVSMSGVLVVLGSVWLFKESIGWMQYLGFFLIIAGVIFVSISK